MTLCKSRFKNVFEFLLLVVLLSSCGARIEEAGDLSSFIDGATPTPTPTYNCAYYNEYDSLSACYTATFANCNFSWKTFPSGGIGLCFKPVNGWETCAGNPGSWVYANGNVFDTGTDDGSGNAILIQNFSVVKCSSDVCLCTGSQVLKSLCTYGVDPDCPAPMVTPTVTPSPTPNKFYAYSGFDCSQYDDANFQEPTQYLTGPNNECHCTSSWDLATMSWPLTCACKLDAAICSPGILDASATGCQCQSCGVGYSTADGGGTLVCTACGPGTSTGGDRTAASCTSCPTGTYSDESANMSCKLCENKPSGAVSATYTGTGANSPNCPIGSVHCMAGYGNGGSTCNACTPGTLSLGGLDACTNCPADTISGARATSCSACSVGEWAAPGSASCQDCTNKPAGAVAVTYSGKGGGADQCPYESVTCTAPNAWNRVTTPTSTGAKCEECTNGTWTDGVIACTACTNTTVGKFWTSPGTSATGCGLSDCTNTTAGNYFTSHGGTSASGCTNTACTTAATAGAAAGTYTYSSHGGTTDSCSYYCRSGNGGASCTQCLAGTYDATPNSDIDACTTASAGYYSYGAGNSSQTAASPGYYVNGTGAASPSPAPAGYYVSGSAATTPSPCPGGSYTTTEGRSVCTQADARYYAAGPAATSQTVCSFGTWSDGGDASCSACTGLGDDNGYYWTSNGSNTSNCSYASCTTKRGASTYTSAGGITDSCSYSCNNGYGGANCEICNGGTYDAVSGGTEACATCVQGYASSTTTCTSCTNPVVGNAGSGATAKVYANNNTSSTCNFVSYTCPNNSDDNGSLVGGVAACDCITGYGWDGDSCELAVTCYDDADGDGWTTFNSNTHYGPCPAGTTPVSNPRDWCDDNPAFYDKFDCDGISPI